VTPKAAADWSDRGESWTGLLDDPLLPSGVSMRCLTIIDRPLEAIETARYLVLRRVSSTPTSFDTVD